MDPELFYGQGTKYESLTMLFLSTGGADPDLGCSAEAELSITVLDA
jgi:hypothetical protein